MTGAADFSAPPATKAGRVHSRDIASPFAFGDSVISILRDGWAGTVTSADQITVTLRSATGNDTETLSLKDALEDLRVTETAEGGRGSDSWIALMKMPAFPGVCGCRPSGEKQMLAWRPSMTAYYWDGSGHDPNKPKLMCDECWESYEMMMQSWWDEYRNGLGV